VLFDDENGGWWVLFDDRNGAWWVLFDYESTYYWSLCVCVLFFCLLEVMYGMASELVRKAFRI
jgi:hypothetical protein